MQFRKIILGVLISFIAIHTSAIAQDSTYNASRFGKWFLTDPAHAVKDVGKKQLIGFGISGILVGALISSDHNISEEFQQELGNSKWLDVPNAFGTVEIIIPASVSLFGVSLLTKDQKFRDAAFTSTQSLLYTYVTTNFAKFVFARGRPFQDEGSKDFDFFKTSDNSFPSGHTSNAFSVFVPWVMYYPGPLTYSLMVIPVGTAVARIAKGKHWLSDVTAGAMIGTAWGYYLAKRHLRIRDKSSGVQLSPVVIGEGAGVSLSVSF